MDTPTKLMPVKINEGLFYKKRRISKAIFKNHFFSVWSKNTDEFFKNTSIHGLNYLNKKDLKCGEKIFFALAFVFVVAISCYFLAEVYKRYNNNPIIISINPKPLYITKEPFPAISVCNLNQAMKSKAEQFSIYSVEYAMLQMLCKREVNVSIASTISDWSNVKNFIVDVAQPCTNMLLDCYFGGVTYNCSELFFPMVTSEGLCCTFNMVHPYYIYRNRSAGANVRVSKNNASAGYVPIDWTVETGYPDDLPDKFYPRSIPGIGESLGLSLTLNVEADEYYCSSANSFGFKILVHNPIEHPQVREIGLLLAPGRATQIRVDAEKTVTDESLHSMSKRRRHCVFQDEEKLDIFTHYTSTNCYMECMAKSLMNYCGCILFYMPPMHPNQTICSIYDISCSQRVQLNAMRSTTRQSCQDTCMSSCFDLNYWPDFFHTTLSHAGFQIMNQVVKNMSSAYVERNIAVVNIYFKEHTYKSTIKTEYTGMTDALSSVGGLMVLFFGFSFLSLIEFVFYALIRPVRRARLIEKSLANAKNKVGRRVRTRYMDAAGHKARYKQHADKLKGQWLARENQPDLLFKRKSNSFIDANPYVT